VAAWSIGRVAFAIRRASRPLPDDDGRQVHADLMRASVSSWISTIDPAARP